MRLAAIGLLSAIATYGSVTVAGAGSTFVAPIATEWCHVFQASHPGIQLTYQSVGSGEGIRRAIEGGFWSCRWADEQSGAGVLQVSAP
jgi:phosphate transport system substrate-binding protein